MGYSQDVYIGVLQLFRKRKKRCIKLLGERPKFNGKVDEVNY
jgi:hypothetical protein